LKPKNKVLFINKHNFRTNSEIENLIFNNIKILNNKIKFFIKFNYLVSYFIFFEIVIIFILINIIVFKFIKINNSNLFNNDIKKDYFIIKITIKMVQNRIQCLNLLVNLNKDSEILRILNFMSNFLFILSELINKKLILNYKRFYLNKNLNILIKRSLNLELRSFIKNLKIKK
jgi:hypothetical protein